MGIVYGRALVGLFDLSEALGVSFEQAARKVGVDPVSLKLPDATVSVDQYCRLKEELQQQTQNPDFGLLSGRVAYIESVHMFMYLASASNTLREWINMIPSVSSMLGDVGRIEVKRKADFMIMQWHLGRAPNPLRCIVTDHLLTTTLLQMDGFSLLPTRPVRVDFTYPKPENVKALNDVFRAPLHFKQPVSALYYDKSVLDHQQIHVSTRVYDGVRGELDQLFEDFSWRSDAFTVSIYSLIRRHLPVGDCSIHRLAQKLNISSRTLQRRLQDRGTSYQRFLQEVKSHLATRYLKDPSLNVTDVALLLGYVDPTSFSAAFKTWYGATPTEFRRRQGWKPVQ